MKKIVPKRVQPSKTDSPHQFTTIHAQRRYLDWFADKHGMQRMEEWYKIKVKQLEKSGGRSLLRSYNGSFIETMKYTFPEYNWKDWLFNRVPEGHWKDIHHQRQYFDWLATQLGIKNESGWYATRAAAIRRKNGASLLVRYNNDLATALMSIYPQSNWNPLLFKSCSPEYLDNWKYQRKFLDDVADSLGIESQADWTDVKATDFPDAIGSTLLTRYGSLVKLLEEVYPEMQWTTSLSTSASFSPTNQLRRERSYLERLADSVGIESQEHWYGLNYDSVFKGIGRQLIEKHRGSFIRALEELFPEYNWHPWLFAKVPANFWTEESNVKQYFDWLAQKLELSDLDDWSRVTYAQFIQFGGRALLEQHTLFQWLLRIYPYHEWNEALFDTSSKTPSLLLQILNDLFSTQFRVKALS